MDKNFILSPIETNVLIDSITKQVTASILNALKGENFPTSKPDELLFNIQEAGNFLKLSVPTIYSKVSRKELPYMKRGKRLYFSKTDLMEFLKSGRVLTSDEAQAQAQAQADEFLSKKVRG